MIDPERETLIPMQQVPKHVSTRPAIATTTRWILYGCRGKKLESILVGGRRYTSKAAIARFMAEVPAATTSPATTSPRRTTRQRAAAIAAAERELAEAGI